jgi:hypothetical protein
LGALETALRKHRVRVLRGGAFDTWDLEVRSGLFGAARVMLAVEEHGNGRQLLRFRISPRPALVRLVPVLVLAALTMAALTSGADVAATLLGLIAVLITLYAFEGCAVATAAILRALASFAQTTPEP